MGTTPTVALPYPELTDVPNVQPDMKNLALATDAAFVPLNSTKAAAATVVQNMLLAGDTQPAFKISGDGTQSWGPGGSTAPDVTLFRDVVGGLAVSGRLISVRSNAAAAAFGSVGATTDTQFRWYTDGSGKFQWGTGGAAAPDTILERSQAGILRATNSGLVTGTYMNPATAGMAGGSLGAGGAVGSLRAAVGTAFSASVSGETQNRFMFDTNGLMQWGPGGTTAPDTTLERISIGTLRATGGNLYSGTATTSFGTSAGAGAILGAGGALSSVRSTLGLAFSTALVGDTSSATFRWQADSNGLMQWGSGSTAPDTTFGRWSAGQLYTPGQLRIQSNSSSALILDQPNSGITFGGDTALYRSAAGTLKTDGDFIPVGRVLAEGDVYARTSGTRAQMGNIGPASQPGVGFSAGGTPDTNLYRASAGQLKTDGSFLAGSTIWSSVAAAASAGLGTNVTGDGYFRFYAAAGGALNWGPGNVATDTNLYRAGSANQLKTDGNFTAGINLSAVQDVYATNAMHVDVGGTGARLYFGSTSDTNLYRANVGVLATDGVINTGGRVNVGSSQVWTVRIGDLGPASQSGIAFGSAADTNLYRNAANELRTNSFFTSDWSGTGSAVFRAMGLGTGGTKYIMVGLVAGEANERFKVWLNSTGNAEIDFGPGGATAVDTNLYRDSAGVLRTNAYLAVDGPVYAGWLGSFTAHMIMGNLGSGRDGLLFGSAQDTNLYRSAANTLRTDGGLILQGGVSPTILVGYPGNRIWQVENTGRMSWGPGGTDTVDVNLYRAAAQQLHTDSQLYVHGTYTVAYNNMIVDYNGAGAFLGFGSAYDVRLSRTAGVCLTLNGAHLNLDPANTGLGHIRWYDNNSDGYGAIWRNNTTGELWIQSQVSIVMNPQSGGKIYIGSQRDTTLFRAGAGILQTDGALYVSGTVFSGLTGPSNGGFYYNPTSGGASWTLVSAVQGESYSRFTINYAGAISWGPGNAAADVNLYRSGATLHTDVPFSSGGTISASGRAFVNDGIWVDGGSTRFLGVYGTGFGMYISGWSYGFDSAATGQFRIEPSTAQIAMGGDAYISRAAAGVLKFTSAIATTSYGTAFPTSPVDGQEYTLVDSTTAPTYTWRFRYNASSTSAYKWEFIGGSPMMVTVSPGTATTWTNIASVTGLRQGDYNAKVHTFTGHSTGNAYYQWQLMKNGDSISSNSPGFGADYFNSTNTTLYSDTNIYGCNGRIDLFVMTSTGTMSFGPVIFLIQPIRF